MPKQVGNENRKSLLAVGYFWLVQQTLSYSLFLVQQYSLLSVYLTANNVYSCLFSTDHLMLFLGLLVVQHQKLSLNY